jgi:hypothetical protein
LEATTLSATATASMALAACTTTDDRRKVEMDKMLERRRLKTKAQET